MDLGKEDWAVLSALLDQALELPPEQRQTWLDQQVDLPDHLRTVASGLVKPQSDTFSLPTLPRYADADLHSLDATEPQSLAGGTQIGPYRLLREVGQGGMGTVWLAERSDATLKREVALKLPHSTLTNRHLAERFNRERDILATLVHPHIARLYDAGITSEGRPYLALEYVDGEPLGNYCEARNLPIAARLKLFLQVLAAVQYAHNQLVVHRDLKPSNVLVTADGQVRLLDFGIAKLLTDGQAQETELTQLGGRALTPQYAAPEQILGQPISTAVDVYALGVMLYELLTGVFPYRLKRDSRGALEEAILETEAIAPSRALDTSAAYRSQRHLLRGDLDTIILKALKKAPAARYATVSAFADDLRRFLLGEPVLAQPDSTMYRTGKFLRRNRWGVVAAVVVVTSLSAGLGFSLWQAQVAQKEARTASAVKDFMQGIFLTNSAQQSDPLRARQTTARDLLDIGAGKLDAALGQAPQAKLEMLKMYSELYSQLDLPERAVEFAQQYLNLTRTVYGNNGPQTIEALLVLVASLRGWSPDDPRIGPLLNEAGTLLEHGNNNSEVQAVHAVLAAEYFADREFAKAYSYAHRAAELQRTAAPDSNDVAMVLAKAARIDLQAGDCTNAARLAAEGVVAAHASTAKGEAGSGGNVVLAPLQEVQGRAAWCQGDRPAAQAHLREALVSARKFFGDGDTETVRIQARLAEALMAIDPGSTEGAELLRQAEQVLGTHNNQDRSRLYLESLAAVGRAQFQAGYPNAAVLNLNKFLALRAGVTASPAVAEALRVKALALGALHRNAEASTALEEAIAMRARSGLKSQAIDREEADLRRVLATLPPSSNVKK